VHVCARIGVFEYVLGSALCACVLRLSVLVIKNFQYSMRTYNTYSCVNV
jgi:hypothetical protein